MSGILRYHRGMNTKTSTIHGLDLSYVLVTDVPRAIAFYRDTLGIEPTHIYESGKGAEFTLADGQTFGVWNPGSGKTGAGVFFSVKNINEAIDEMRARGLQVSPPDETDVCFMAFAADPDGNGFALHQRKEA